MCDYNDLLILSLVIIIITSYIILNIASSEVKMTENVEIFITGINAAHDYLHYINNKLTLAMPKCLDHSLK